MSDMNLMGTAGWIEILPPILIIAGLYFTFTFFENLKGEDRRLTGQAKLTALICFGAALLIPALYKLYIYNEMFQ